MYMHGGSVVWPYCVAVDHVVAVVYVVFLFVWCYYCRCWDWFEIGLLDVSYSVDSDNSSWISSSL